MSKVEPVTFAVIKSGLDTIVDEMAYTVMRTARSSIVRDVLDYSVTICDREGRILTQAKTVALHLGAVPDGIEALLQRHDPADMNEGDVFILNDPYTGGMHLPDIFMFRPIFVGGEVFAFSVVIAHHTDMGGRVAGSNAADSTEIFQEGLRISPMRLFEAGKPNEVLFEIIRRNVRLPDLVIGDLESQMATCLVGEREILKLANRYGAETLSAYFDALIDYGERLTSETISSWPDGTYRFTDHIDGDGMVDRPIPIACEIRVKGGKIDIDFEGSSPQVKGAINSTLSFVKSASCLAVRCVLDQEVPNNAGVYRCINVTAPEGSVLNPRSPAPVAARALTGYRVVDAVMGALAQIVPDRVRAAGEGGNTVVAVGGYDSETHAPFVMVDMINGAWGGGKDSDGVDGVTNPSQNMSNLPVETMESRYPMRIDRYGFRADSGGAGKHRGGLGLVRKYTLLADRAVLQVRADRVDHRPYGLEGGGSGAPGENYFADKGQEPTRMPPKFTREVEAGASILHYQAGAGGYGDPFERDPEQVAWDVSEDKVTRKAAEADYGVVLKPGSFHVDVAATAARRASA